MMLFRMAFVFSAIMAAAFIYLISKGEGGLLAWIGLGATLASAFNSANYIAKHDRKEYK